MRAFTATEETDGALQGRNGVSSFTTITDNLTRNIHIGNQHLGFTATDTLWMHLYKLKSVCLKIKLVLIH